MLLLGGVYVAMARLVGRLGSYVNGKSGGAETVRYIIVGALTTLINYALFELLYSIFKIDVTVSNVISITVAILFAYVSNKLIVFRRRSGSPTALLIEFVKFIGSRLITMALELGIMLLFHNVLGINAHFCKAAALVLVIVANYFLSRLIVFNSNSEDDNA